MSAYGNANYGTVRRIEVLGALALGGFAASRASAGH